MFECKRLPFTFLIVHGSRYFSGDIYSTENVLPTNYNYPQNLPFPTKLDNQEYYKRLKLQHLKEYLKENTSTLFAIPIMYTAVASGNNVGEWLKHFVEEYILEFPNVHLVFYNGHDIYGTTSPYTLQGEEWIPGEHFDRETYFATSLQNFPSERLHFYLCNVENLSQLKSQIPNANYNFFNIYFSQMADTIPSIHNLNFYSGKRKYNVICLNSRQAPHRDEITDLLDQYDTAIYSYRYKNKFLTDTPWDRDLKQYVQHLRVYTHERPQEHSLMRQYQNSIPNSVYTQAYFYICTETEFYPKHEHIFTKSWFTEKTLKSFVYKWPMLMVGNCKTLSALKTLGFETFPEIFDEKYDEVENSVSRMHWIKKEIEKVCTMSTEDAHNLYHSSSVQQKLEHNKNHFFKLLDTMDINKYAKKLNIDYRV